MRLREQADAILARAGQGHLTEKYENGRAYRELKARDRRLAYNRKKTAEALAERKIAQTQQGESKLIKQEDPDAWLYRYWS